MRFRPSAFASQARRVLAGHAAFSLRACAIMSATCKPVYESSSWRTDMQVPARSYCCKCKQDLPSEEFYHTPGLPSGLSVYCRQCASKATMRMMLKRGPNVDTPTHKQCSGCGQVLPSSEYYASRSTATGLHSRCKTCYKDAKRLNRLKRLAESEDERCQEGEQLVKL